jgi:hypothetical protein
MTTHITGDPAIPDPKNAPHATLPCSPTTSKPASGTTKAASPPGPTTSTNGHPGLTNPAPPTQDSGPSSGHDSKTSRHTTPRGLARSPRPCTPASRGGRRPGDRWAVANERATPIDTDSYDQVMPRKVETDLPRHRFSAALSLQRHGRARFRCRGRVLNLNLDTAFDPPFAFAVSPLGPAV